MTATENYKFTHQETASAVTMWQDLNDTWTVEVFDPAEGKKQIFRGDEDAARKNYAALKSEIKRTGYYK